MSDFEKVPAPKRKRIFIGITFLAIMSLALAFYWFFFMRGLVTSDDARLDGDLVDVAPQISGVLDKVLVEEGDRVHQGQLLFSLDKGLLEASLSRARAAEETAKAHLDVAQASLEKVLTGPRPKEIQVAEAEAERTKVALSLAGANWTRIKSLYQDHAISASERDKVRAAYDSARFAHDQAQQKLSLLQEGSRDEDIRAAKANVAMLKSQLNEARAAEALAVVNLGYADVRAPFDGLVVRTWQKAGAMLPAGRPVLTLFNPDTLYVSANVEEKDLGRIHIGDKVDITVDAFPGLEITGRLDEVLLATNSEFSLVPSEGVSGTFIKVAQRLPVRITLDPHPPLPLGPGLSVEIAIHTTEKDPETLANVDSE